jgi:hypothetical protein
MLDPTVGKPRSLAEVMAAGHSAPVCPQCGCTDLRGYKVIQLSSRILRYRACRNCGHKVLTRQPHEQIVRDVSTDGI